MSRFPVELFQCCMLKTFPPNAQRGRLQLGRAYVDMTFYPFAVWHCQGLSLWFGDYVD